MLCVVFSVLVVSLWRPYVPPSLISSESVLERWARKETQCPSLLTSSLMMFSTGTLGLLSIPVPSNGAPAVDIAVSVSQRLMSTWDVYMSPGNTYKWIIKSGQPNTLQKLLSCTLQAYKPCTCLDLRPKKDPRADRDIKGVIDGMSYIWSKRVLQRHPLWIAEDRQKTAAAAFFTLGE